MMAAVSGDDRFKDEVMRLVGGLRASKVQELFDVIDSSVDRDKKKSRVVRQALIDHLNRSRPHRARRLFMSLFEPLLITDPLLLRSPKAVPGVIQRLDAGCLWNTLSRFAFGDLAEDVQRQLDDMAKEMLLEQALSSDTAARLLDQMRDRAVAYLDQLRANEVALNRFLNYLNRLRSQEVREKYPAIQLAHELERGFVEFTYDVMILGREGRDLFTRALAVLSEEGGKSGGDLHRRAATLAGYVEELRRTHPATGRREGCLAILPLAVINVRRAYQVGAGFAQARGQGDMGVQIGLALMGHFSACINEIAAIFGAVLAQGVRISVAPILLSTVERAELEAALPRLADSAQAVRRCGILSTPRQDKVFAGHWDALFRVMIDIVAEAVAHRLADAVGCRAGPSADHEDVLWLANYLLRWRDTARACEQEPLFYTPWRGRVEEIIQNGVNGALRFDEGDDLGERLDHLMRIDQVCHLIGLSVSKFISLTSHNVCLVVLHRLQRGNPIPPMERRFLREFVMMVDRELKSSPSWKVAQHVEIQRAAELVDLS